MGRPLNLFALLDQAAARFGDRGAVYHGERQLHTWGELRERALRLAGSLRELGPGARIAVASENRPEIIELMFAVWAAECVYLPINYKLHAREMQQILDDAGAALVFASPKIAAELTPVTDVPVEVIGSGAYETRLRRRADGGAVHRPGRTGLAVLHQRNDGPVQGRDAVASQPDGDDGRPSRGFRFARRGLQPGARRTDVTRLGSLHPALRAARGASGDTRIGRVRARGVPRSLRAPSGLQRLPGPHDGPATGADRTAVPDATCARWSTAAARCTSTA